MRYSGIQQTRLDIARYAQIQLDTAGIQRDTVDLERERVNEQETSRE